MSQNDSIQLIAELFKRSPKKGVDDPWLFACCYYLYAVATPEMTTPITPLLAIVNDEAFSDSTRIAALAVLSRIGGEEVKAALGSAKPLMPGSRAGKEVRAAVFDALEGKDVQLSSIEGLVKAIDIPLVGVKFALPQLMALANVGHNRKLRKHLLDQADGLVALAKEIRQGL